MLQNLMHRNGLKMKKYLSRCTSSKSEKMIMMIISGWQLPFKGNANNEESLASENNRCQRVEKAREQESISEEDLLRFSLFNIHPFIYYLLWDYTWITLVGYISSNRHIRQSLVYLLFDSLPDSEDSRYLDSFLFWDRQHRNKSSQKSKIRTKSTSRFDCYFAIYKWQKTNYQG